MKNLNRTKFTHNSIAAVVIVVCLFVVLCLSYSRWTRASILQSRQPVSPESIQVCDPEIGSEVGAVTFQRARQMFLNQGLKMNSIRRNVQRSSDLAGSIAVFGKLGKWIYITNAELWYDPEREIAGYARLQGILHNGQAADFDIRSLMPEGFSPVDDWRQLGYMVLKDIDGKMRRVSNVGFEVTSDGSLMNLGNLLMRQTADGSWASANWGEGVSCNARGAIVCNGMFCAASCSRRGDDCHCNYYSGVCMTAPGLNCGGDCDPGYACRLLTPNPGSLFCSCWRPFSDQRPQNNGGGCDPYVDSTCECVDDYGNVDASCARQIHSLPH